MRRSTSFDCMAACQDVILLLHQPMSRGFERLVPFIGESSMPERKTTAEVRVSKTGPRGRPVAEVQVSANITGTQLGAVLQSVVTNDKVLKAAGLKICDGCKSGLDIHVYDQLQDVIRVEG